MIGKKFAHYSVVEKIGMGGMGEVYRAHDSKLGRDVAVKTLPSPLAADKEYMARFEQEARTLASLNHPGIAAVYGVENAGGEQVLIMELVEGEDLSQRLSRGRMTVGETLRIARQLAEALEEAHSRGIVHRDLKPGNIKVPPRGTVKILDFGLAKTRDLQETESAPTAPLTMAGVILGTAGYMSPEQARGQSADMRSDIWSYGCVIWECLTGDTLFGGKTSSDSIGAILHTEPDWSRLPENTPPGLRRVLRRCLIKDRDNRLHHIADARIEIEEAEAEGAVDGREPAAASLEEPRFGRSRSIALLFIGFLVGMGATIFINRTWFPGNQKLSAVVENPLAGASFSKLTNFPGDEMEGVISPDGRLVAFLSDRDGPFDVLVGQIGVGGFRNLTAGMDDLVDQDVRAPVRSVGFTHDGASIWFGGGTGRRLRSMPVLGGSVRNLLGDKVVNVDWSPGGIQMAYHLWTAGDPLYVAEGDGSNARELLPSDAGNHQHYPTWSRDGSWIFLVRGRASTGEMDLWRLRPDGEGLEQLTVDLKSVAFPTPVDENTVLFCAREPDGAGPWLWALDLRTRAYRRLSFGLEQYSSLSASADGRRIVATVENPQAGLWQVPILDRIANEEDVEPFPVPTTRALAPRFGGNDLFYLSSRGFGDGLWCFRNGEAVEIWKGSETPLVEVPAVSPDGKEVALVIRDDTRQQLVVVSADGAERRLLTDEVDVRGSISWSPDGNWIVTGGSDNDTTGLFRIPAEGGPPERILDGEALSPIWSPADDLIVYTGPQIQAVAQLKGITPDGATVRLPEISLLRESGGERMRFLPDGRGLVYMSGLSPSQNFWLLDLSSMEKRPLTQLEGTAAMQTFDIDPSGSKIVFDRLRFDSDLVLIERQGGSDSQ